MDLDYSFRTSYPEAIKAYTEAIKRQPDNHVNYSNRAACYIKLMALPEALKDADKCIELEPTFGMLWLVSFLQKSDNSNLLF